MWDHASFSTAGNGVTRKIPYCVHHWKAERCKCGGKWEMPSRCPAESASQHMNRRTLFLRHGAGRPAAAVSKLSSFGRCPGFDRCSCTNFSASSRHLQTASMLVTRWSFTCPPVLEHTSGFGRRPLHQDVHTMMERPAYACFQARHRGLCTLYFSCMHGAAHATAPRNGPRLHAALLQDINNGDLGALILSYRYHT